MATAIAEVRTKEEIERERSEGFVVAANWIREHNCGDKVSVVAWGYRNGLPLIILDSVKAMKELLPGVTAEVKKDCNSTQYLVTVDGIDFQASKYGCSESPTNWTEVL